jgi:DNA polymerase-3 subunit chi
VTRVDFYILGPENSASIESVACRLTAKAFEQGHGVYVMVETNADAQRLDDLMWTFRDVSFVPHKLVGDPRWPDLRILLGAEDPPAECADILINLRRMVPPVFSRFERVMELVPHSGRDGARTRYRYYQERGYTLSTHELN